MKTIVITGASSGIGKACAIYFANKGWRVVATMRTLEKESDLSNIENVTLYSLDVCNQKSINDAKDKILSDMKTVDVVLNNAGYGLMGPLEAASTEQIQQQFATNVFGLIDVTKAFLSHFKSQSAGMFINVTSIGGLTTFPFGSLYHSSKWAVEGLSESIFYELGELGIQVKIIEPGLVSTDFSGRSLQRATKEGLDSYNTLFEKTAQARSQEPIFQSSSTPEYLAEKIFEAATDGKDQLRYVVGDAAVELYQQRQEVPTEQFLQESKKRWFS